MEGIRNLHSPDASYHDLQIFVYGDLDDTRKASDEFREAVRLRSLDPHRIYNLGATHRSGSGTTEASYKLGKALAKSRKIPEANKELVMNVKLRPNLSQPHYLLGHLYDLYDELGDHARAAERFRLWSLRQKGELLQFASH